MSGVQNHLQYEVRCTYFERNSNACSVYPALLMNNSSSEGAAFSHTAAKGCTEESNISTIEYDLLEKESDGHDNYQDNPLDGIDPPDQLLLGIEHTGDPAVHNQQDGNSSNNNDDGSHSAPILLGGNKALDDLLAGQQDGLAVLNGDNLPPEPYGICQKIA